MIDFKKDLNEDQQRVVFEGDGSCLVLSGPGSGKTRTLVYRTAYLLKKGVSPSRILLLTFTKKAAKEMIDRVEKLYPPQKENIYGGTFHHIANLFLRKHALEIGYQKNYTIIDEDDAKSIVKEIKKKHPENQLKPALLQKIFSLSVNAQKNIDDIIQEYFFYLEDEFTETVTDIFEEYKKKKKESNLMDYDDLLFNFLQLLNIKELQNKISNNFLYVLVDEYQDTNAIQNEIIKKISSLHGNILAVGDDAQSIYSFRAADISNILNFSKQFKNTRIFKIEKNYRSSEEIVEMANNIIKHNTEKIEKNLLSTLGKGVKPVIKSFINAQEQATYIIDTIKKGGGVLSESAILFRAHHHAAEIELELTKRKIPYTLRGGVKFFEQLHTKDVTAFLRIFLNFKDEPSWKRILLKQEKIGEMTAEKIIEKITEYKSLEELIQNKDSIIQSCSHKTVQGGLKTIISALEESKDLGTEQKIDVFLDSFYQDYLKTSFDNYRKRDNDIKKIKELSLSYDTLEEVLENFMLSEDYKPENKKEGVVLSTVHQAKGLEWESVFVINLKEGHFPHLKSAEEGMIEEERRLFYVAITRCKKNLTLSYPQYSLRDKQTSCPSRFLREIHGTSNYYDDEEIIEDEDEWEFY